MVWKTTSLKPFGMVSSPEGLDSHRSWNLPWELHPLGCSLALRKKNMRVCLSLGCVNLVDSVRHAFFSTIFLSTCFDMFCLSFVYKKYMDIKLVLQVLSVLFAWEFLCDMFDRFVVFTCCGKHRHQLFVCN